MYSNLTKTSYDIKDMNLNELRTRIVKENNLTPLDILKGFHAKSNIDLKYDSCITEQNRKDISLIQKEYENYVRGKLENLQAIYDEKFNNTLSNYPSITLNDYLAYRNNHHDKSLSVDQQNDCFRFGSDVRKFNDTIRKELKAEALNHTKSYVAEIFGDSYIVQDDDYHITVGSKYLPCKVDVNAPMEFDFSNVYETYSDGRHTFEDWICTEYDSHIESEPHTLKLYEYDTPVVLVHLTEENAKETFDKAINNVISQNNSINELEFFQNLEAQPITINHNTKTDKYELIDGYKRILYVTDEKLLDNIAPVKVFTDLTDKEFLTILYAANMWKTNESFHDRGFLFALKTRFGFTIPSCIYKNLKLGTNELDTIQLYDFGGNLCRVDKSRLMNTMLCHSHLANDLKVLYNFEYKGKYKYDDNMLDEIMFTIVELTGELRRQDGNDTQNELTEELVATIFEDELIKNSCFKKHLSTRTYVMNYFRDKDLYKHIANILKDNLTT